MGIYFPAADVVVSQFSMHIRIGSGLRLNKEFGTNRYLRSRVRIRIPRFYSGVSASVPALLPLFPCWLGALPS